MFTQNFFETDCETKISHCDESVLRDLRDPLKVTMSMPPGGIVWCSVGGRRLAFFRIFLLCSLMFQNLSPQNYLNYIVVT